MPTEPEPDDRPLTVDEYIDAGRIAALCTLAGRVATHLDPGWQAKGGTLHSPDGTVTLTFIAYGYLLHNDNDFHIAHHTPTGRISDNVHVANLYTLPSQIAADIKKTVIPQAQRRLQAARKQQAKLQKQNDARKAIIDKIALRLNWNSSSYKCHSHDGYASLNPRLGRRRPRDTQPVLQGHIRSDDDGTMSIHLGGLPEDIVEQIVDLLADHFTLGPDQPDTTGTDK